MTKQVKVLHLSTHNENCGIGKYQEMFLEAMAGSVTIYNKFFDISPNKIKIMPKSEYLAAFSKLKEELREFDILHIQHEYSFYWNDEMERAINIARSLKKKVIVTVHTSANVAHHKPRLGGVGPRSLAHFLRAVVSEKKFFKRFINPLKKADIIIVHNEVTKRSLTDRGVSSSKIRKITIPVPAVDFDLKTQLIREQLNKKSGDIIFATVGFLHRFKGVKEAVRALKYLPENYKLAIIGGLHPETDDMQIYDQIANLIIELKLENRVYITGYVSDDAEMNALIRECDICVYPYDKDYYSNVSSAALNNAFANHIPVITYPTESFKEIQRDQEDALLLTDGFAYYELARSIKLIDLNMMKAGSKKFAEKNSYNKISTELVSIYNDAML